MLVEKSVMELSSLLEKNEICALDIARDHIQKIKDLNQKLNAYITVDENIVLKEAEESDQRRKEGNALSAYDGIPVAVKDNICTKGTTTTCASGILRNYIPPYDATVVSHMKRNGFITLGKTNLDEFAMGSTNETSFYGSPRNPYDTDRVPGGSSGGSAVSVASRMAPAALGSDTGGSIRLPASFCGVVGIKPTYGRVSRYGLVAYASSLDQIGTFARTVDDAALMLGVISGRDPKDSTSIEQEVDFMPNMLTGDVKDLVIGLPDEYFSNIAPDVKSAVLEKVKLLEGLGARIEPISLQYVEYAIPVYYLIATAEASSNLARYDGIRYGFRSSESKTLEELYTRTREDGFGKEAKRRIILGTFALSSGYYDAYYLKALKGRTIIINDFKNAFTKVNAIITPVAPTTAFRLGEKISNPLEMYMTDICTLSANLAAIPGLSIPVGLDGNGLPVGMQIMGNHFDEKVILNIAKAVENHSELLCPAL